MKYVNLGTSGLKVSRICLGMMSYGGPSVTQPWAVGEDQAKKIVKAAIDGGINFFDTADIYSAGVSEEVTGKILRKNLDREQYVLATKAFGKMTKGPNGGGLSAKHLHAAIDASLKRLGVEYVDLYQIHRFDPTVPMEETMGALEDIVRSGKARYIGASSMFAWQFAKFQNIAEREGWTRFISMQNHYNLAYREEEREMNPQCLDMGVGLIPWSPLARGLLTRPLDGPEGQTERAKSDGFGKHLYDDSDREIIAAVEVIAAQKGVPMAQVALAWLLGRPGVSAPIIGATKLHHLTEALGALEVTLSEEETAALEAPYRPHPVVGHS